MSARQILNFQRARGRLASISRALAVAALPFGHTLPARAQMSMPQPEGRALATSQPLGPAKMGDQVFAHLLLDQFEGRTAVSGSQLRWDGEGWIGTDMNRIWLKSEGFSDTARVSDGDHEALYDRPIPRMRYFDAQVGVRADLDSDPARVWAALGVEGMAPYFFEFAPTLYVRNDGNVAGRLTGSYDLLLSQRWIVQPEAELNFYNKDDPGRAIGSGLSNLDAGVRLRYEVRRKLGPYIGFSYNATYGNTANYSRQAGESTSGPRLVFGLRLWY